MKFSHLFRIWWYILVLTSILFFVASSITATEGEPGTSQFALLMDAIKKVEASVEMKLSGIKRELSEERESADEHLVKKIRLDSMPSYRKKDNKRQFLFNEQV